MSVTSHRAAPRVAYQGVPGAFSEGAALSRWADATTLPSATFADALSLLGDGRADYAVVPVWNSTIGIVEEAQRAIDALGSQAEVEDELLVAVRHCLLALPGATFDSLSAVGSHPAALGQCAGFLEAHSHLVPYPAFDTAGAARDLSRLAVHRAADDQLGAAPWYAVMASVRPRALAVIAARAAAERYGLAVLAEQIQDDPDNVTRFAVVRARGAARW